MFTTHKLAGPAVFYSAACVAYILCGLDALSSLFQLGWTADIAGMAATLVASVPRFIPALFGARQRRSRVLLALNALVLTAFVVLIALASGVWFSPQPGEVSLPGTLTPLALVGLALTLCAGYLGWKLLTAPLVPELEAEAEAEPKTKTNVVPLTRRLRPDELPKGLFTGDARRLSGGRRGRSGSG